MSNQTERLYYDDPYKVDFCAEVTDVIRKNDKTGIILNKTCFYPESGGQPADKGTINGIDVVDVSEEEDRIIHWLKTPLDEKEVKGKIDWQRRFDHMQQHAGQHILSQSFYEIFEAETRSFHLGESFSTVEIAVDEEIDGAVEKVEKRSNEVVFENRPIKTYFIPMEKVNEIPLRRPPVKTGLLRIVEIDSFDYSACGGTHPRRTGEVGLIKILRWERIRGNVRFEFVCGRRALADYSLKHRIVRKMVVDFNVKEEEVYQAVAKLSSSQKDLSRKLRKLNQKLTVYEAEEMINDAENPIIVKLFEDRPSDELRNLALNVIKSGKYAAAFGSASKERCYLVLAASESLGIDLRKIFPRIASLFNAKGGGRPSLVEMAGEGRDKMLQVMKKVEEILKETLKF